MFSVVFVILFRGRGPYVTITHDALDLALQGPPPPPPDMGPHSMGTPSPDMGPYFTVPL